MSALYVLQARVLITCNFFLGMLLDFFLLMYARVHTCACVCCIVSTEFVCPDPLIFSTFIHFFLSCSVFRYTQRRLIQNARTKLFFDAQ